MLVGKFRPVGLEFRCLGFRVCQKIQAGLLQAHTYTEPQHKTQRPTKPRPRKLKENPSRRRPPSKKFSKNTARQKSERSQNEACRLCVPRTVWNVRVSTCISIELKQHIRQDFKKAPNTCQGQSEQHGSVWSRFGNRPRTFSRIS